MSRLGTFWPLAGRARLLFGGLERYKAAMVDSFEDHILPLARRHIEAAQNLRGQVVNTSPHRSPVKQIRSGLAHRASSKLELRKQADPLAMEKPQSYSFLPRFQPRFEDSAVV